MIDLQEASRVITFLYHHVSIRSIKECGSN